MKQSVTLVLLFGIGFFIIFLSVSWAGSPSFPTAIEASPDIYKILLKNDHVRVLVMELNPGEMDEWHHHPDETVYFEKGGKLKIHLQDGTAITNDVPDGGIMWHDAWAHQVENVGKTRVRAIIVENITSGK